MFTVMYGQPKPSSKEKRLALSGSYLLLAEENDDNFIENLLSNQHFANQFPFVLIESNKKIKTQDLLDFYYHNGAIPELSRCNLLSENGGITFDTLSRGNLKILNANLIERLRFIILSMEAFDRLANARSRDTAALKSIEYKINREKRFLAALQIIVSTLSQYA